jgi:hypothetical protein
MFHRNPPEAPTAYRRQYRRLDYPVFRAVAYESGRVCELINQPFPQVKMVERDNLPVPSDAKKVLNPKL